MQTRRRVPRSFARCIGTQPGKTLWASYPEGLIKGGRIEIRKKLTFFFSIIIQLTITSSRPRRRYPFAPADSCLRVDTKGRVIVLIQVTVRARIYHGNVFPCGATGQWSVSGKGWPVLTVRIFFCLDPWECEKDDPSRCWMRFAVRMGFHGKCSNGQLLDSVQ